MLLINIIPDLKQDIPFPLLLITFFTWGWSSSKIEDWILKQLKFTCEYLYKLISSVLFLSLVWLNEESILIISLLPEGKESSLKLHTQLVANQGFNTCLWTLRSPLASIWLGTLCCQWNFVRKKTSKVYQLSKHNINKHKESRQCPTLAQFPICSPEIVQYR